MCCVFVMHRRDVPAFRYLSVFICIHNLVGDCLDYICFYYYIVFKNYQIR